MAHTLRVQGGPVGNNVTVELDGHDISNLLRELTVHLEVGKVNEVYLTMALGASPVDLGIEVNEVKVLTWEQVDAPARRRWWQRKVSP